MQNLSQEGIFHTVQSGLLMSLKMSKYKGRFMYIFSQLDPLTGGYSAKSVLQNVINIFYLPGTWRGQTSKIVVPDVRGFIA